jgi:hypothetical protein
MCRQGKRRPRLGVRISRFLLDLDQGVHRVLDWRERLRSLPEKQPRKRRRLLVGAVGVAGTLALVQATTTGAVQWPW